MKVKNLPLRLDEIEHKELKLFCVQHGISMQEFIMNAIRETKKKWAV
jgi:predicted HicB family RNase H-like nuclease